MHKKISQCEKWDDIFHLIVQLSNENAKLKKEKQILINELMNLKLKIKQKEKHGDI